MNIAEFTKILLPITELYGRTLSPAAIQVYFEDVELLDAETFKTLLKHHRASEQGKFWPTFSHLIAQAGTEDDVCAKAGIEFDHDSSIDKSISTFDRASETTFQTVARRKRYIERKKLEWKQTTPIQRLSNSVLLPGITYSKNYKILVES